MSQEHIKQLLEGIRKPIELLRFIEWIALPTPLRNPRTKKELAKELGVSVDTLTDWKHREGFWKEVNSHKDYFRERMPNVILGLYNRVVKDGNVSAAIFLAQYVEGWDPKKAVEIGKKTIAETEFTKEEMEETIKTFKRGGIRIIKDGLKKDDKD